MTPDELDRLADEATPGPWYDGGYDEGAHWIHGGGPAGSQSERGVAGTFGLPTETSKSPIPLANARLIALAPTLAREHAALLRWADQARRVLGELVAKPYRADERAQEMSALLAALDAVTGGHQ